MKILIVGLGSIGQRHARNLRQLGGNDLELIAYRTRRLRHVITPGLGADASRDVEREYRIDAYSSLAEALQKRPDAAFICNPSNLHVQTSITCLRAGCDLFLEKPAATTLEEANELLAVAEREAKDRIVMVGYQARFHPCFRKLAEFVASGILGNLLAVRAVNGEYMPDWHPYEDYREAYSAKEESGGGILLAQSHEADYLYALFGMPRRVFALGGHWSELEISCEDTASVLMEAQTPEGRTLPIHLHQDFLQRPQIRQCEVIGDRGKAVMDLVAANIIFYERNRPAPHVYEYPGFERNQLFLDQTQHFLDCLRTRQRPVVDLRDGLNSVRIALAAKLSIARGERVSLAELGASDG